MNLKYPGLAQRLTKILAGKDILPCVLDGELVPYNTTTHDILPFAILQKMSRKLIEPEQEEETPTKIVVFDCLSLGEDDLTERPLEYRKSAVELVFETIGQESAVNDLLLVESVSLDLSQEESLLRVADLLKESKKEGFEGLIVKPTGKGTTYVPRSRTQWIKIKALANEGEMALDTLDLVVMAVYKGSV